MTTDQRSDRATGDHDLLDFLAFEEQADLTTCDREPIHVPGAIQPHGVLLAVREDDLVVVQTSANSAEHLDVAPAELIGAPLHHALGHEPTARLRAAFERAGASRGADPVALRLPGGAAYEATWHRVGALVVVELECALGTGPLAVSSLFEDVRHALDALQETEEVQALCDTAVTQIKHLTGYDRVMVYRFHPDEHGEVVAERRADGLEPYLGLHYPASDIPRQARKLYLRNHLRMIADVDYEPAALLGDPRGDDAGSRRLDLSLAGLRSVSPLHVDYLRNMGVQATLTISLMRGTRLWGMIACHHQTPRRIDAQLRAACRLLGQMFSLQIIAQENQERQAYRTRLAEVEAQIVGRLSGAVCLATALADARHTALALTDADGMVARIDGRSATVGYVPPPHAVEAVLDHMRAHQDAAALICDDLPHRFVELAPYATHAAGVLALPLSADLDDVILWFRGEVIHTVTWAGNPHKALVAVPPAAAGDTDLGMLGPRESFQAWVEEVRGRCRPWLDAEVEAARCLAAAVPEVLLSRARNRLAHLALHDSLTGMPNRALLMDRTEQALARPHHRGQHVALLFVDLDRFKLVNDSLGHTAGDAVLCEASARLTATVRATDTVARFGGDEFAVLCDDVAPIQAEQLAQRIVSAFQPPFALDDHDVVVTASVGVAIAEVDATPGDLLHDADTAMYRAKRAGRNAVAPFTPEMRAVTLRRVELETGLRPALERGHLRLYFQPLYTVGGVLTGFEALARWPLPDRGMVPPAEFIPVAESTGLIAPLTAWALDEGLHALARWRRRRPQLDLSLSVNVSPTQMTSVLGGMVADALQRHDLPPSALCLEITEGALVVDDTTTRQLLTDLRTQGIRLSIDDFGTGFSSLAYLAHLPVDEVKIDRAFIRGLPTSRSDATIVASVVELAHQLGLRAVAEGVETDEQFAVVRRLGCDLVQGYLLGRPQPHDQIDRLLGPAHP